jgi:hypothetical protein
MKPSKQIEAEVRRLAEAFANRDPAIFETLSKQAGVLGIGSDPKEWLEGRERIVEVFGPQMVNMPRFRFDTHRLAAYEQGDVGWAALDGTWAFPDHPKMEDLSTRLTLVYEREEGNWKMVLMETAFAFPDERVFAGMAG